MKPSLVCTKGAPDPKSGGYSVSRPTLCTYIVLADSMQDALDAVSEVLREGCTLDGDAGVAPESAASKYDLKAGVPEVFHG